MSNLWGREPALIITAVQAAIALAVAFGLDLTVEQTGAILAATAAVLGVITRQAVYAPKTVDEKLDAERNVRTIHVRPQ